jgi:hypothetical protein
VMSRSRRVTPTRAPPLGMTGPATTSTATPATSSLRSSPGEPEPGARPKSGGSEDAPSRAGRDRPMHEPSERHSLGPGPGVTYPKSRRSGFEPAALESRAAPDCPPGPAQRPCIETLARRTTSARCARLSQRSGVSSTRRLPGTVRRASR